MKSNDQLISSVITFLRFPLCVAVVYIHSLVLEYVGWDRELYPLTTYLYQIISVNIAGIAVPLFFFISGFLFFYNVEKFDVRVYMNKMKKRIYSLIVPYISWNIIILMLILLVQILFPSMVTSNKKLILDYSITDYLWTFWNTNMINPGFSSMPSPICGQFWFLRDLIVLSVCSPIIYLLIKYLNPKFGIFLIILSFLWVGGFWFPIKTGLGITGCVFFAMGAYFPITKRNIFQQLLPLGRISVILYIILVMAQNIFTDSEFNLYLHRLDIICGIISVLYLTVKGIEKNVLRENKFLTDSNFFIYAYHVVAMSFITKLLLDIFPTHTDSMILIMYLLTPVVVILLGISFYWILKKYFPLFIKYTCRS